MADDPTALPRACRLVADAAAAAGLPIDIQLMEASTRTAEEAAAACKTSVAQIVKSLVFRGKPSGSPILLLVSGVNRVKETLVQREIGEKIERPDADFVREVTGFAIGGIPPLGHVAKMAVFVDEDLLQYQTVFAAAGTPNAIFAANPGELLKAAGGKVIKVHD